MARQFYRIDWDTLDRSNLFGREAMVYSALMYLCKNAPYIGTPTELANFSRCGSYKTAERILTSLSEKGLINIQSDEDNNKHITLNGQNVQEDGQNVQTNGQNVQKSKEKEKNQKNKERKINENSMCIKEAQTHTTASPNLINQLFFMNTIEHPTQDIPANTGYYKIIVLEYGYLKPKEFIDDMYLHYESHGWPYKGNKLELMRYWMTRYTKLKHSHKPNLDENERIILRTFLDKIEQRLIVRLLDVLQGFEVTDKAIIFRVKAENTEKFTAWLTDIDAPYILAAYNREVQVGR